MLPDALKIVHAGCPAQEDNAGAPERSSMQTRAGESGPRVLLLSPAKQLISAKKMQASGR